MDGNAIGKAALITWAAMGVTFDKHEETTEQLTMWISVHEHSFRTDVNNNEMAGMHLAKRFKTVLSEMGVKRLKVLAKVRTGETWTKENADAAEIAAKKAIYGNQW